MGILLDILIKKVISITIYIFFLTANIHIKIDYIEKEILNPIMHIIENMHIQKETTGIKTITTETKMQKFMDIIMIKDLIKIKR